MAKDMKVAYLLDFYGDLLTDKQRDSLDYYYNEDLSLGEIAANLGISRQGVRDNIKRAEAVLFELEEKLHLAEKFSQIKDGLDSVRKAVDVIDDRNMKIYRSKDINESIKMILRELDRLNQLNQ
ncbi:MAG: YlxM family DNA-binding protein [Clostridia bacterium]|nr:YlxM family DNA-binding protein [Clostridia bacterium]